jgi:hypothetical protein
MEQVVTKYLKSLRIPVSQKYCEKLIRSHPDYPSLLSISDTLTRLGIEHKAARVSKEQLAGMEAPFLAWLNANGGGFTLIDNPKDLAEQVELICHEGRSAAGQDSEGEAVILMADPAEEITDPENGEPLAEESFQRTLFITLLSATTGMVLLASVTFFSWIYLSLLVTAMVGAVVGYLLVARDVGVTYDPVKNFCRAGLVAGLFLTIVSIVFLIKTRLKESSEAEHAEAAASRAKYDPSEDTEKVMQDWFELEDLSQFREKYPLPSIGETPAIEALAARHSDWFDKADVKGTPTFFVNGYQLPGQYRIEDLSHLVVGLSEEIPVAREKTREAKTEQNH